MKNKLFKKIWIKLNFSNQNMHFMDVKELSERMEASEIHAKEAVKIHLYNEKRFNKACKIYAIQCERNKRARRLGI